MNRKQLEEQYQISDESAFPSLSLSLEELHRHYDIEQDRKSNIEVRIGAIVGIDALLISVVGVFGQFHIATKLAILIPALVAAGFGLAAFNSREYLKPGPEVDEIFGYARMEDPNAVKNFIQNYRQAIKHNTQMNTERMDTLDTCFSLTAVSFVLILVSPWVDLAFTQIFTRFG
jgi:hypothetical protein